MVVTNKAGAVGGETSAVIVTSPNGTTNLSGISAKATLLLTTELAFIISRNWSTGWEAQRAVVSATAVNLTISITNNENSFYNTLRKISVRHESPKFNETSVWRHLLLCHRLSESSLCTANQQRIKSVNQAAPSASAVTTGGTNINYQTNNTYQNEVGFGPGVFCRTPTLYIGGNAGNNKLDAYDAVTESGNVAKNYAVNAGIVYPFGSSAIEACKTLAKTISRDREISTQLYDQSLCRLGNQRIMLIQKFSFEPCINTVLKKNTSK